jgi:hypothetical protein
VASVLAGDAVVAASGEHGGPVDVLVGTISACHGAASLLHLGTDPSLSSLPPLAGSAGRMGRGTPGCSIFGVDLG